MLVLYMGEQILHYKNCNIKMFIQLKKAVNTKEKK